MKTSPWAASAAATLAAVVLLLCVERRSPAHPAAPLAEGTTLLGRLPVAFVPNVGQWEHTARFVARIGPMTMFLEEKGWTFTLVQRTAEKEKRKEKKETDHASARGVAVRMTFVGASTAEFVAEDQLPGRHNYFLGNDASKWRSDVPLYRSVRYQGIHPGVDVRAREQDGHFEYDLLLQSGAELEAVEIAVAGSERMHVDGDGALVLETRLGPVRMPAPPTWEEGPSGERSHVTCRYCLRGADRFGFEVSGRRPGWALVVDPGLVWSTFLGGAGFDHPSAVAVDAHGAATVAGKTYSTDFPATPGAFNVTHNGGARDAFVTRLSPAGSGLVYSTFLGGTSDDAAEALALDPQGGATVAGSTRSTDFPATPGAFDPSYNGGTVNGGGGDAFVTRLSPAGSGLVYSTFLGGASDDWVYGVALDAQGLATVAGHTNSADFPTTPGALDPSHNGADDVFVTRLSATGSSLVWSTFLGGTRFDQVGDLALDAHGAATVVGTTLSTDFPTTPGAFDTTFNGVHWDAFVARLSPAGSSLVYSTLLGGTHQDAATAVALDVLGAATVAGFTFSTEFPTTPGAFDRSLSGWANTFVTRLSPTGSALVYSTLLGGATYDIPTAIALDAQGAATVAGSTGSADFPTTPGAFAPTRSGVNNAFVTRLSPAGSSLVYSTFLGGTLENEGRALALDAQGAATVAGWTKSADFPTTPGAFDTTHNGGITDAFVTRLDLLPTGVSAFGRSSGGCTGPLAISVTSMPRVGNQGFALTCGNAPANTTGLVAFTAGRFQTPVIVLGVELWIDPAVFMPFAASSNHIGASDVPLPIPNDTALANVQLFAQFFWAGATSPLPCPPLGVSASNALDITIQP